MKRLYDSYLFKSADKKINFIDNIRKVDLEHDKVKPELLEDDLKVINRKFLFSLKSKVMEALKNEKIIMIFPETVKLSKLIPIYLTKHPKTNEVVAVVNIGLYATKDRQGNININNRRLYGLLECALIDRELYLNENKFLMNSRLYTLSAKIYTKLFNKILDKKFALNLTPRNSDQINFLIAKFFMLNVLEKPNNDLIENVAYQCIFNDTSRASLSSTASDFSEGDFMDLKIFIESLKKNFDYLSDLNIRSIMFDYMTMYGDSSIFSLEYYPTMLECAFNGVIFGSNIVKDAIYDSVAGKEINDLHAEFGRLI